jgi:hypothetical protein
VLYSAFCACRESSLVVTCASRGLRSQQTHRVMTRHLRIRTGVARRNVHFRNGPYLFFPMLFIERSGSFVPSIWI